MRISSQLKQKLIDTLGIEVVSRIETLNYPNGDYLDIAVSDNNKISYIPTNALEKFEALEEEEKRAFRETKGLIIKLSKLLKLCGYDNPTISALTVKYNAANFGEGLTVQYGKPSEIYGICHKSRTLYGCMNSHYEVLDEFYGHFNVSACLFRLDGQIIGRALLWHAVDFGDFGIHPVLDRVYTNTNLNSASYEAYQNTCHDLNNLERILNFAKKQGWLTKTNQSFANKTYFTIPDGTQKCLTGIIKANSCFKCDFYPYIDTFSYIPEDFEYITNDENQAYYVATNTNGGLYTINAFVYCYCCERRIEEEENVIEIDGYCFCCIDCAVREGFRLRPIIDRKGRILGERWIHVDDDSYIYLYKYNAYTDIDNVFYCHTCDEHHLIPESNYLRVVRKYSTSNQYGIANIVVCDDCLQNFKINVDVIAGGNLYTKVGIEEGDFAVEFFPSFEFNGELLTNVWIACSDLDNKIEEKVSYEEKISYSEEISEVNKYNEYGEEISVVV